MTGSIDRSAALVPDDAHVPALDAHGFDPADDDWIPVRRVAWIDGWSEDKQRAFIGQLADTGSVMLAARAVGLSAKSACALRRAWAAAVRVVSTPTHVRRAERRGMRGQPFRA